MNEPGVVLRVHAARKSYGRIKALDGVDLTVSSGEFVALLGPNGAGKTTLFQLLSGLFVADGGTIEVLGHDIGRDPVPALAGIGVVFQQSTLDLELSVRGNLRFHARLHGLGRARAAERIVAEAARIGLAERLDDRVRTLSGGTRRRVELARALLHEPKVLLMDEPTVGLDPATRRDLLAYVRDLCRERGLGVLWATHLIEEAEAASRVIVLHHGHVLREGAPSALLGEASAGSLAEAFLELTNSPSERAVAGAA